MADTITAETLFALFKETRDLFSDTDRKMQETDRKMQENSREMREMSAATDRKMQETDRKIKEVSKLVGNLGNRLGEFVENMVTPAVLKLFRERGIDVHQIFTNATAKRDNDAVEVDVLAVNGVELVATECKSKLNTENVDEHIERLQKIKVLFPQWAGHRIYGAVATMVLEDSVAKYAEDRGLFVIAQSGDTVEIRNSEDFVPKPY